jgi:hypothetical protein
LFSIVQNTSNSIPSALNLRAENYTLYVLLFIIVSILLIALAKLSNSKTFKILLEVNTKGATIEQYLRENMRTGSLASIALLINYYAVIFVLFFLTLKNGYHLNLSISLTISVIAPISLLIYDMIGIVFIGLLTGEFKRLKSILLVTITTNQITGIVLFLLALFWTLNPQFGALFFKLSVSIFLIKVLFRIIKGIYIILNNGVSLYYIILYFCTLEILPLMVLSYFFWGNL